MKQKQAIVYRKASPEDLPAVVALCMAVEEQHEGYWRLRWERRPGLAEKYLGWMGKRLDEPRMFIHVARDEAADVPVVGMILATIVDEIPIYTFNEYALVQDMAVREGYRRRGIAQRLLAEAAKWAKVAGMNQLRLMVADQNPTARKAFEKAGFRATYQEMVLALKKRPVILQ
jgi:GNAT superfamily N-acetyltransferase